MSAYIVDKKTIDRVVTFMVEKDKFEEFRVTDPDEMGQRLWQLNADSVNSRYNEANVCDVYKYSRTPTTAVQALKSLACLLYQSCEGGCHEKELFVLLDKLKNQIAISICYKLHEYSEAEWC